MRWVDELLLKFPFAGAKMLSRILKREGQAMGRRRVSTLKKLMNICALYCKPNGSQRHAKCWGLDHRMKYYLGWRCATPSQQ
jgi:putative transposase